MLIFLQVCCMCFAALVAAAYLMEFVFRILGSEFGVKPLKNELGTDIFVSLAPAVLYWACIASIGHLNFVVFPFTTIVTGMSYRITHHEDMEGGPVIALGLFHTVFMFLLSIGFEAA